MPAVRNLCLFLFPQALSSYCNQMCRIRVDKAKYTPAICYNDCNNHGLSMIMCTPACNNKHSAFVHMASNIVCQYRASKK